MAVKHGIARLQRSSVLPLAAACLSVVLASACSSGDSTTPQNDEPSLDPDGDDLPGLAIEGLNGTPADQLTSPWLAHMTFFRLESITPGTGDAFVKLVEYDDDFTVQTHLDFYTPELDACDIRDLSDTGDGEGGGGEDEDDSVSGGRSLTLNNASGNWYELQLSAGTNGIYETDNGLPSAFPGDLTLSIPGDVFPGIAAYPLVEPTPPVRLQPNSDTLTLEDILQPFTWIPPETGVPGGFVELVALEYDSNDEFVGFPIVCSVVDDGNFSLPQDVIVAFGGSDNSFRIRFERVINRIDYINGVVFHQRTEVAE